MSAKSGFWILDGLHEALMKERDFLYKEMKNLEQENARLREALTKIALEEYGRPTEMMLIARKALESE